MRINRSDDKIGGVPHISKVSPVHTRPVCQCCGKPLKPSVETIFKSSAGAGHEGFIHIFNDTVKAVDKQTGDDIESSCYNIKSVSGRLAWTSYEREDFDPSYTIGGVSSEVQQMSDIFRASFWCGKFDGVCPDENDVPAFCKADCAIVFAHVMYKGGHRVRSKGKLLDRPKVS